VTSVTADVSKKARYILLLIEMKQNSQVKMTPIDINKARQLRDRARRDGIGWRGDPVKEGDNWCFPFVPADDDFCIQSLVKDRDVTNEEEERLFIREIEEGVGLAKAMTDYVPREARNRRRK
jgi:hypothetical protein